MKKLLLSILSFTFFACSFAQNESTRKPATIGISLIVDDFTTAADIKKGGLGSVFRNHNLFRFNRLNPGVALNYLKGFTNHIDFEATLAGSFVRYPVPNQTISTGERFLLEGTVNLNIKLLDDKYWVVPFADFGLGVSKYLSYYAAFIPIGLGIQVNIFDQAYLIINSQFRAPVTESAASYLYHSVTIAVPLGQKKK